MGHVFDVPRNNNTSDLSNAFAICSDEKMEVSEPIIRAVYCLFFICLLNKKKITTAKQNQYKGYKKNEQKITFWLKRTICDLIKKAGTYVLVNIRL